MSCCGSVRRDSALPGSSIHTAGTSTPKRWRDFHRTSMAIPATLAASGHGGAVGVLRHTLRDSTARSRCAEHRRRLGSTRAHRRDHDARLLRALPVERGRESLRRCPRRGRHFGRHERHREPPGVLGFVGTNGTNFRGTRRGRRTANRSSYSRFFECAQQDSNLRPFDS